MSYIISGVRSSRARTSAGLFEIMSIVDIVAYHSDRQKLHRIKEIKPAYLYQTIPFEVKKNAILMFMAELCAKTIREPEQNYPLFACIENHLRQLDLARGDYINRHLEFMVALADQLGFGMSVSEHENAHIFDMMAGGFTERDPGHPYVIADSPVLESLIARVDRGGELPKMHRGERNQLIDQLLRYFKLHIDNMPEMQSHKVLREIL